jgi:hypothetical protein
LYHSLNGILICTRKTFKCILELYIYIYIYIYIDVPRKRNLKESTDFT